MALPVTFVAGEVLEANQLNSNFVYVYPDYVSFTPTIGGWTQGNATFSSVYCTTGEMVNWQGFFTFGSTSAVTTTSLFLTLPVNQVNASNNDITGTLTFRDISTGANVAGYARIQGATQMGMYWLDPETAPLATRLESWVTTATLPFTFATGDIVSWNITYPRA
jgi:hypothetical protein